MEINNKQKYVLIIFFWIVVSLIIFPPYEDHISVRKIYCGSPFIFGSHLCPIDTFRLITRLFWTVIVGGVFFILASYGGKKQ